MDTPSYIVSWWWSHCQSKAEITSYEQSNPRKYSAGILQSR